jgi:acyl carrier protein phosphodiesterase
MSLILRRSPHNWYQNEATFLIDFLRGYVLSIERNAGNTIKHYEHNVDVVDSEVQPDNVLVSATEIYDGLTSDTFPLEVMYRVWFPNMQRRSALLTLFSLLERTLEDLCDSLSSDMRLTVDIQDIKGNGLERTMLFMKKVVGLQLDLNSLTWNEIRSVQKIRNVIAHADGRLEDQQSGRDKDIAKYIDLTELINYNNEILLEEGYLQHVVVLFDRFFKEIDQKIRIRQST